MSRDIQKLNDQLLKDLQHAAGYLDQIKTKRAPLEATVGEIKNSLLNVALLAEEAREIHQKLLDDEKYLIFERRNLEDLKGLTPTPYER